MQFSNQGRFRQQVRFLRRQFLQDGGLPFTYFRLYSPKRAFLDKTWVLPDIEKAEE